MDKPEGTAVHTNVVIVSLAGALKIVIVAVLAGFGYKADPMLQEAIGTIFMIVICWKLRGDAGLMNKINYSASIPAADDKEGESNVQKS